MKRLAATLFSAAVAIATSGCATQYQAGSTVSGGTVSSYSSFAFSARSRGAEAAFGAPLPGAATGNSVVSNASGIQLNARNGAAVVLVLAVGLLNLLQEQVLGRDGTQMVGTRTRPFGHLSPEAGATFPWSGWQRAPAPDPGRRVRELDCTQPFELDGANIQCR